MADKKIERLPKTATKEDLRRASQKAGALLRAAEDLGVPDIPILLRPSSPLPPYSTVSSAPTPLMPPVVYPRVNQPLSTGKTSQNLQQKTTTPAAGKLSSGWEFKYQKKEKIPEKNVINDEVAKNPPVNPPEEPTAADEKRAKKKKKKQEKQQRIREMNKKKAVKKQEKAEAAKREQEKAKEDREKKKLELAKAKEAALIKQDEEERSFREKTAEEIEQAKAALQAEAKKKDESSPKSPSAPTADSKARTYDLRIFIEEANTIIERYSQGNYLAEAKVKAKLSSEHHKGFIDEALTRFAVLTAVIKMLNQPEHADFVGYLTECQILLERISLQRQLYAEHETSEYQLSKIQKWLKENEASTSQLSTHQHSNHLALNDEKLRWFASHRQQVKHVSRQPKYALEDIPKPMTFIKTIVEEYKMLQGKLQKPVVDNMLQVAQQLKTFGVIEKQEYKLPAIPRVTKSLGEKFAESARSNAQLACRLLAAKFKLKECQKNLMEYREELQDKYIFLDFERHQPKISTYEQRLLIHKDALEKCEQEVISAYKAISDAIEQNEPAEAVRFDKNMLENLMCGVELTTNGKDYEKYSAYADEQFKAMADNLDRLLLQPYKKCAELVAKHGPAKVTLVFNSDIALVVTMTANRIMIWQMLSEYYAVLNKLKNHQDSLRWHDFNLLSPQTRNYAKSVYMLDAKKHVVKELIESGELKELLESVDNLELAMHEKDEYIRKLQVLLRGPADIDLKMVINRVVKYHQKILTMVENVKALIGEVTQKSRQILQMDSSMISNSQPPRQDDKPLAASSRMNLNLNATRTMPDVPLSQPSPSRQEPK